MAEWSEVRGWVCMRPYNYISRVCICVCVRAIWMTLDRCNTLISPTCYFGDCKNQKNVYKSLISSWVVERSRVKVQRGQNKAAVSWKRRNCNAAIYIYISVCLCAGLWSLLRYKCILLHQGTFGSSGRQAGSQWGGHTSTNLCRENERSAGLSRNEAYIHIYICYY